MRSDEQSPQNFEGLDSYCFEDVRIAVPWGYVVGRWYGNRQVRPILALHGWLDNLGTWDTLVPLLPPHVGVLCVDLPGHGRSSKYPRGMVYHVIDYVHIIQVIMKEYNWHKVSLMGHSMGSIICFIYTALHPRSVDLLIAIDVLQPVARPHDYLISRLRHNIDKLLVEDERLERLDWQEPPSYAYEELERLLYEGSSRSVELEYSKFILNRSIAKSAKYPNKYYFSRDGRVKHYVEFSGELGLFMEMAKRICNVPYFVVKATNSAFINDASYEIMDVLRVNNPHFEFHELEGSHHVHLNNAHDVAYVLNPFIHRHRPAVLESWTIDEDAADSGSRGRIPVKGNTRNINKRSLPRQATKWIRSKL